MYIHGNFQDATIYYKKVTREEAERFDQPSYKKEQQYARRCIIMDDQTVCLQIMLQVYNVLEKSW